MTTRHNKAIDLTKILRPFENKWVALSMDYKKVLGSGKTLAEARKQAEKSGKEYLFHWVSPFNVLLAPLVQ